MRAGRVVVSLAILVAATLAVTSLGACLPLWLGWVESIQVVPLALAGGVTGLATWMAVTLIFGRIYCSSVCPLGTLQDIFSRIPRLRKGWREGHPYHYAEPNNRLRYLMLVVVALSAAAGTVLLTCLLDPWSAFSHITGPLLAPLTRWATVGEIAASGTLATLVALALLGVIGVCAWRRGRIICNTICPAGSALALPAKVAMLHFDIDTDLCTNCRACEHACKAQCISMADHTVDASRCVVCFDCVDACRDNAIRYTTRRKRLATPMMRRVSNKIAIQ